MKSTIMAACVNSEKNNLGQDANDDFQQGLENILQLAKQGDKPALEELFAQVKTYIAIVAQQQFNQNLKRKIGESDVVQQTMLHAADKFESFRGISLGEFKAWLKQILINEVHGFERTYFAQKRDLHRETENTDSQFNLAGNVHDSLATPGTQAAANEQADSVNTALQHLPEDYQTVIALRNWNNLSFAQIAAKMKRSENAVTKLWFRALAQLQDELDKISKQNDG